MPGASVLGCRTGIGTPDEPTLNPGPFSLYLRSLGEQMVDLRVSVERPKLSR